MCNLQMFDRFDMAWVLQRTSIDFTRGLLLMPTSNILLAIGHLPMMSPLYLQSLLGLVGQNTPQKVITEPDLLTFISC